MNIIKIVFFGDWCLKDLADVLGSTEKYNRVPYHWDDRKKYQRDYQYLNGLYEETLSSLAVILNKIHSLDKDIGYWRIVVGPWLRCFLDVLFDRYECVTLALKNNQRLSCEHYLYELEDWCPADFPDLWEQIVTDEWNEVIFSECIKFLGLSYRATEKSTNLVNSYQDTRSL